MEDPPITPANLCPRTHHGVVVVAVAAADVEDDLGHRGSAERAHHGGAPLERERGRLSALAPQRLLVRSARTRVL